jgi:hypothetical protein
MHALPLMVAVILSVTAVPIELGMGTVPTSWPPVGDFIANLLLFVPVGAALSRQRLLVVGSVVFALSCTIELIQYWSLYRFTSPFDVLANTLGGLAGAVLWKRLRKATNNAAELVTLGRFAQLGLAVFCAAVAAAWLRPSTSSAIVGWDPSYALLLGNEGTGNRGWAGVIEGVAILPETVAATTALQLSMVAPEQWRDVIPRFTLLDTHRYTLDGSSSFDLPQDAAHDFAVEATAANAFTVVVRMKPASLERSRRGPVRILSFSGDRTHRNMDLAQRGTQAMFRVRTPVSGENASRHVARSAAALENRTMTLVASYDGAVARVYVDGKLAARSNLAAAGCRVRVVCDRGANMAWIAIGASAVVLAVAMLGALSPSGLWWVGVVSGASLGAVVASLAGNPRIVPSDWTAALPFAGALAVVLAIRLAAKS